MTIRRAETCAEREESEGRVGLFVSAIVPRVYKPVCFGRDPLGGAGGDERKGSREGGRLDRVAERAVIDR